MLSARRPRGPVKRKAPASRISRAIALWSMFAAAASLSAALPASALTLEHKGLVAGWLVGRLERPVNPQAGARFIPEFSLSQKVSGSFSLAGEFSFNGFGVARFPSGEDAQTDGDIEPYRFWLRLGTDRFEARIGLQKINFGSASLLRPLMWFDSLDPRDPLQLTDGVYGVLLRYYFLNNTNIWAWALYGNDSPKGWEAVATAKGTVEFGGRAQLPLWSGELALTYHHRQFDIVPALAGPMSSAGERVPESRIGLDGKWDLGVGLWIEGTLTHQESDLLPQPWQRAFTVGLDYTFKWGNGLNVLGEHLRLDRGAKPFGPGDGTDFSALFFRYPVNTFVDLTAIFYYDWKEKDFYRFLSWQRTYDRWRFSIIAFWNPDAFRIFPTQPGGNPFSGKGLQIMAAFNY
ncbi:MAG: hypothetical protein A2W03_15275 [Candidatus Aminicenantes bacterium RBG_16_63_16]|nr:MAG: hypothetical protein A2W03_15275 [Candidatus Aminicenantes bacterium RBG_16_63_16]